MRQAITVKFVPITDANPNYRWRATCAAKSRAYDQADNADPRENAWLAAKQLATELGWAGVWYGGATKDGNYVFVQVADGPVDFGTFTIAKAKRPR